MRAFVNAANVATTASLAAGFAALMLAAEGRLRAAAVAVLAAALLDAVDGLIARRQSLSGRFGCHLDSLSDLVAFGAAPALILHRSVLDAAPVAGAGVCLAFVLAGAWRLARFQLAEDTNYFEGLPVPVAGLAVTVAAVALPARPALVLTVVLAALMVSSLPFPTVVRLGRLARRPRLANDTGTGVGRRATRRRKATVKLASSRLRGANRRARAGHVVQRVRRRTRA